MVTLLLQHLDVVAVTVVASPMHHMTLETSPRRDLRMDQLLAHQIEEITICNCDRGDYVQSTP